jgi:hypothetical protein
MQQLLLLFIAVFLWNAGPISAQQGGALEWVLPLQAGVVPIGKPASDRFALREKNALYLLAPNGVRTLLPYDSISHLGDALWATWDGDLQGIYAENEGELLPPVYESISPSCTRPDCWAFVVGKYGLGAVVNDRNEVMLPWREWEYIGLTCLTDTVLEYIDKKGFNFTNMGYVSRSGKPLPATGNYGKRAARVQKLNANKTVLYYYRNGAEKRDTFALIEKFADGIAVAKKDSLFGYLSDDGTWLIRPKLEFAAPFGSSGHALAKEKGRFGLLRKNGTWAIAPKYEDLQTAGSGLYQFKESGKTGLADSVGTVVLPPGDYRRVLAKGHGSFAVQVGDTLQIFDAAGKLLPIDGSTQYEPADDLLVVRRSSRANPRIRTGVARAATGEWVLPQVLEGSVQVRRYFLIVEAQVAADSGRPDLPANDQPGKFLLFDRSGKLLLPYPADTSPRIGGEPYAVFQREKKFGVVSGKGIVLEPKYDAIDLLPNGWVRVRAGEQWGMLRWRE